MFNNKTKSQFKKLTILSTVVAGILHVTLASSQHSAIPPEMVFFILAGLAQVAWAIVFMKKQSDVMYYFGIVINGGLLVVWALTRILPAPFLNEPEHIGTLDLIIALIEGLAIFTLVVWHEKVSHLPSLVVRFSLAALIALVIGFFGYYSSMAATRFFPDIEVVDHHGVEIGDKHADDGHDNENEVDEMHEVVDNKADSTQEVGDDQRHDDTDDHHD
ncbi:MAG: hypothetical protein ACPGO5_02670 [Patescibacteria group bacterium]